MARGRTGQVAADRLPRPRHERPDRLPLPALRGRARGRRFHRQARGHRQRHRRQRRPPAHAGEHHPRRRELLGILSQRAASISCAALYRRVVQHPQDQAGARRRLPRPATRPPTSSATSSPAVGSSTTSASGSATPSATGPGTCCTRRGSAWCGVTARKSKPAEQARPGLGRTVHRRGERLVLVVRRQPQQRQDGLFDRLFRKHLQNVYTGAGRAAADRAGPAHPPGTSPRASLHRADRPAEREGGRPADLLRVDQRRPLRLQRLARHDEHGHARATSPTCTSASTPSGCCCGSTRAAGRSASSWPTSQALRVVFLQPEGFELVVVASQPEGAGGAAVAPRRRRWPGRTPRPRPTSSSSWPSPSAASACKTDEPVHFYVELLKDKQPVERVPHEGAIETAVPSPDYELIMWQA